MGNGADQHGLGYTLGAVATDVASDFATARGVADMNDVLQVESCDQRGQVVGVSLQIVAVPGLASLRIARVPRILGEANFLNGRFMGERWNWRTAAAHRILPLQRDPDRCPSRRANQSCHGFGLRPWQ